MIIERPSFPNNFDFKDHDAGIIAEYLYEETNATFSNITSLTDGKVIKTYRTWNDIAIPLSDYPVLKVYANAENVQQNQEITSTAFTIAYGLAFTIKQKVPDISRFIAKELIRNLTNAGLVENIKFQVDWTRGIEVNYETLLSPENTVYRYTTISTSIFTYINDLCY